MKLPAFRLWLPKRPPAPLALLSTRKPVAHRARSPRGSACAPTRFGETVSKNLNTTYNIHGAHPPNRAPRDRLWKRQPLQRWRQPPNLLAKPGRPLRVVSPLRLALQDVWRVAIAILRHGSADHWPHFKTHARKVWGHATLIGQLLLSCPSAECTAPARSRSSPAHHIPLHTGRFVQSC